MVMKMMNMNMNMMNDAASREMDMQAKSNGWTPNPNNSDARYAEKPEMQVKRAAFESKSGYSGSHKGKMMDMKGGMPMPSHMKKDCY